MSLHAWTRVLYLWQTRHGSDSVFFIWHPSKRHTIRVCLHAKDFDCVDHTNSGKFLKKWIPDHLTCLLRNLYAGQEATVRTRHGTMDWFKIGKGEHQGYARSLQSTKLSFLCFWTLGSIGSSSPEWVSRTVKELRFCPTFKLTVAVRWMLGKDMRFLGQRKSSLFHTAQQ